MSISVSGSLRSTWRFQYTGDSGFFASIARDVADSLGVIITSGTGADQCNRLGIIAVTLAPSTPATINLQNLQDWNGVTFTDLARVRLLALWNTSTTNGASVTVGPDASNGWTNGIVGNANGEGVVLTSGTAASSSMLILAAPNATGLPVSGTNRVIRLTPSAHAQTIKGLILGASS